jgi:hypothetical protein
LAFDVSTGKATRREWTGLGIIALPCVLYAMDLTILNLAIPSLSYDLKPTAAQLSGFCTWGTVVAAHNLHVPAQIAVFSPINSVEKVM